jgi:hypothetical protein
MNTGKNRIAEAFLGGVSYRDKQARSVCGFSQRREAQTSLSPSVQSRGTMRDTFSNQIFKLTPLFFSWAPTVALQQELLRLYRPFKSRFERQSDWLPRFKEGVDTAEPNGRKGAQSFLPAA